MSFFVTMNYGYYAGLTNADQLFMQEETVIRKLANKCSWVIIDRCADFLCQLAPSKKG